jgi:hypothetical protein
MPSDIQPCDIYKRLTKLGMRLPIRHETIGEPETLEIRTAKN